MDFDRELHQLVDQLDREGVEFAPAVARGLVAALHELATRHAPAGDVGRFGDAAIARACGWTRTPATLVSMLVRSGVLAVHPEHRLVVQRWFELASDAVHAEVARSRALFADGSVPRLGPLAGAERQEAKAHYDELLHLRSAEQRWNGQLSLFSSSSLRDLPEEEKKKTQNPERAREPRSSPAPRRARGAPPPSTRVDPGLMQEALARGRAALALYGRPCAEIREGPRLDLAASVLLAHEARGADALAHCVHGYWSLHGRANERWDPHQHLVPETVWGPKCRKYLDAYDDALARGLSPPFLRAGPKRAARDIAWVGSARQRLEEECAALRATAMAAWRDPARADREVKIFLDRGSAALSRADRSEFRVVIQELLADARDIATETTSNVVPWEELRARRVGGDP